MVDLKPPKPKKQETTIVRRSINQPQLLLLVLISILIHILGLFLLVRYQPQADNIGKNDSLKPIDFTVIPEEPAEAIDEDEIDAVDAVKNDPSTESQPIPTPPAPSPPPQAVTEPEPPPPTPASEPPPQAVIEPEPIPSTPAPETVAPPKLEVPIEEVNPTVSSSDNEIPEPEPEPEPVAAKSPSENVVPPEPEVQPDKPVNPDRISTSASDLLGGDYEKTLASGGDAFFSPEALEYNSVLNPEQLKALKGIDLSQYLSGMESKVKPNWNPAFRSEDRRTVLTFKIEKDGRVTGLTVAQSSGLAEVDRESIAAIEKSAPFDPLPADFPLDSLEITFSFNIHIY